MQRPESRPYTSDAAKRIMMNPLIKSHSPRVKITSKFQQGPSLPYSQNKRGQDEKSDIDMKTGEDGKQIKNESLGDKNTSDSKEIKKDNFLDFEEGKKKTQTPGFGNEIRIRPVSAHIMKRMHNNLGQTSDDKSLKEDKIPVYSNSNAKEGDALNTDVHKQKNAGSSNTEAEKEDPNIKGKPAVERPKSAIFVGRLGNKPAQTNSGRDLLTNPVKITESEARHTLAGGWWKNNQYPLMTFGYGGLKKQGNKVLINFY